MFTQLPTQSLTPDNIGSAVDLRLWDCLPLSPGLYRLKSTCLICGRSCLTNTRCVSTQSRKPTMIRHVEWSHGSPVSHPDGECFYDFVASKLTSAYLWRVIRVCFQSLAFCVICWYRLRKIFLGFCICRLLKETVGKFTHTLVFAASQRCLRSSKFDASTPSRCENARHRERAAPKIRCPNSTGFELRPKTIYDI